MTNITFCYDEELKWIIKTNKRLETGNAVYALRHP